MSKYKRVKSGKTFRYMANMDDDTRWRLVPFVGVPENIKQKLNRMDYGEVYDDNPSDTAAAEKVVQQQGKTCVFCGEPGTRRKFVFLQTVFLCEEHWNNKTTGEVGQRIKELQHA